MVALGRETGTIGPITLATVQMYLYRLLTFTESQLLLET